MRIKKYTNPKAKSFATLGLIMFLKAEIKNANGELLLYANGNSHPFWKEIRKNNKGCFRHGPHPTGWLESVIKEMGIVIIGGGKAEPLKAMFTIEPQEEPK